MRSVRIATWTSGAARVVLALAELRDELRGALFADAVLVCHCVTPFASRGRLAFARLETFGPLTLSWQVWPMRLKQISYLEQPAPV